MARDKLLERAFIQNRLWEQGEVVEVDDSTVPGPHMLPQDGAAKKMAKEAGLANGPIPDPVDEITADGLGTAPQDIKSSIAASDG